MTFSSSSGPVYLSFMTSSSSSGPLYLSFKTFSSSSGPLYLSFKTFSSSSGPLYLSFKTFFSSSGPLYLSFFWPPLSFLQDLFLVFWPSPSIMCFRRQFLVKMCPFQLPYLRVDEGTEITNWMQAIVFHLVIQVIFSVRIQVLIPGPKAKISNVFGSSLLSTCTHYCDSVCNQSSTARFPIFSIIYLLSFLIWPLIYNRCRCRGLVLHLITLNVTQTHNR